MSNIRLIAILALVLSPVLGLAKPYPGSVEIHRFQTDKVIYKPGETVSFQVVFTQAFGSDVTTADRLFIQVWIERELDAPFLATETSLEASQHERKEVTLKWTADRDVFGHRAWVRFADAEGRLLAESDTLFDVASDWIDVMRLATLGANASATKVIDDAQMQSMIQRMREGYFNAFEVFTFSPEPYVLAPIADSWPYQYTKPDDPPILRERLQTWSKELHRQGFKFVAYNETSAISGPEDLHFFKDLSTGKPYATYFEEKGMFTPNAIKVAPRFATQLAQSIRMFGWDGILMDSAIDTDIRTSQGYDRSGHKLTDLSAGEVGYQYLAEAHQKARALNPDFRFLSQNATSVSHIGVREPVDKIYLWVTQNAERMRIREYSKLVDIYTAEIDANFEPHDGRYPLTYETMSVSLNSLVEVLGRPLMAWAYLVPPYPKEYAVSFVRPYFALHLASRTHVDDHFDFYGGAASEQRISPAAQQFIRYNRFLARFSYYLHDPELKWLTNPRERFTVTGSKPLFWERTVYRRPLPNGGERIVINLLNLPSNGKILDQTELPPPAQNVTLTLGEELKSSRVVYLSADDPSLQPLALEKVTAVDSGQEYRLPPITCWALVVIETGK
jgi:hypothetical protein